MNSLFDRIANEIGASNATSDQTAETIRPSLDDSGPGGILFDMSGTWPAPDISTQIDRPRLADRQCSRSGCADAAAVTLTYHYGQSQVWIDTLWPEREPHMYDLCSQHAARLSVPRGWHLDDRRHSRHTTLIAV
jgi:Protein of unknown function (DUF3499)